MTGNTDKMLALAGHHHVTEVKHEEYRELVRYPTVEGYRTNMEANIHNIVLSAMPRLSKSLSTELVVIP